MGSVVASIPGIVWARVDEGQLGGSLVDVVHLRIKQESHQFTLVKWPRRLGCWQFRPLLSMCTCGIINPMSSNRILIVPILLFLYYTSFHERKLATRVHKCHLKQEDSFFKDCPSLGSELGTWSFCWVGWGGWRWNFRKIGTVVFVGPGALKLLGNCWRSFAGRGTYFGKVGSSLCWDLSLFGCGCWVSKKLDPEEIACGTCGGREGW